MQEFIAKITQILLWILIRPILLFFLRIEIKAKQDFSKLKKPLIVIANHATWLDPFLVGAAFPLRAKIMPIRFAIWHKFFWHPLNHPFLVCFGAFPVLRKVGLEKTLKVPLSILPKGGVVGIFPEGKRIHYGRPRRGRRGAAYMAMKSGAPLLPLSIEGTSGLKLSEFLLRKRRVKIYVGEMFALPSFLSNFADKRQLNKASLIITNRIRELPYLADWNPLVFHKVPLKKVKPLLKTQGRYERSYQLRHK